jgi:hypothetical protein
MSRPLAFLILITGALIFVLGLVAALTALGAIGQIEEELLEYPLIGPILSAIWDVEMVGRSMRGEWARSAIFVQVFSIISAVDGVLLVWLGASTLLSSQDDWRRR